MHCVGPHSSAIVLGAGLTPRPPHPAPTPPHHPQPEERSVARLQRVFGWLLGGYRVGA